MFNKKKAFPIKKLINYLFICRNLKRATKLALSGEKLQTGNLEKPLTTHFELLNLVPSNSKYQDKNYDNLNHDDKLSMKWRRVGLISGKNVQLDTIVWPGGDIVVSGLSAKSRSIFRVVTALAPPFVMETDLEDEGICLRGLMCYRVYTSGRHNLTVMFNKIEKQNRLKEDENEGKRKAVFEEGVDPDKISYK